MASRYDYKELRAKAISSDSTKEDRLALYDWCCNYMNSGWNGEFWDIDDGLGLYPVYQEIEDDVFELIDAEIR